MRVFYKYCGLRCPGFEMKLCKFVVIFTDVITLNNFLKSSINLLKSTFFLMDITFQFCQYKCNLWFCYFAVRPPCARLPLCAETFSECSIQKKNMDSSRIFRHIKMLILEMITSLLVGFFFCSSRNVDFCQINSPSAACWLLKNVRITQVK